MHSRNTLTTAWTPSPTSCLHKCSKLRRRKTLADYYRTKINQVSRWKKHTRFSSWTTGWKCTRSSPQCTRWRMNPTTYLCRNRTSLLSNLNNDSSKGNKATTGAAAITDHADRTTGATATIARTSPRTPASPETTSPETVNTVYTAK